MNSRGKLIVISAPSGCGKTTIAKAIMQKYPAMLFSVSATTRTMRSGEVEGKDYFFLSKDEFQKRIKAEDLVEWEAYPNETHGNYYGTLRSEVDRALNHGKVMLFDVDVKGALSIKKKYGSDAVRRVQFIRHAQALGFSLEDIAELLALRIDTRGSCSDVRQRSQRKLADIAEKIASLKRIRLALEKLVESCSREGPSSECPILGAIDEAPMSSKKPHKGNVSSKGERRMPGTVGEWSATANSSSSTAHRARNWVPGTIGEWSAAANSYFFNTRYNSTGPALRPHPLGTAGRRRSTGRWTRFPDTTTTAARVQVTRFSRTRGDRPHNRVQHSATLPWRKAPVAKERSF